MNRLNGVLAFLVVIFISACGEIEQLSSRDVIDFGRGWTFSKDSAEQKKWEEINLPHTFQIEPLVVTDMWQGTAWYQKQFNLDLKKGQRAALRFEGVMHEARVWLNGDLLAHHLGGYLPFTVDLTSSLKKEGNLLRLEVNNEDNPSIPPGKAIGVLDFSYYGGIYRDVTLSLTQDVYITDAVHAEVVNGGGILVHFDEINSDMAKGEVKVHVQNDGEETRSLQLITELDASILESAAVTIEAGASKTFVQKVELAYPRLWSPTNPELYELKVKLVADETVIDEQTEIIGIRDIAFKDDGFYLNGEKMYIRGTNRHQEYPYIGYALSDEAQYRDAVKIKNAGFDMVRLSHYPQDEAFLRACDELGLIVMNCMAGWQFFGDQTFIHNAYQDIRDMSRRDRNHPSIFFWEVSLNESEMSDEFMVRANEILKEELPYDDIYSAGWMDHPAYDLFIPARQHGQAPDYWNFYKNGERKVFIAEYGDWEYYAQNAGFNQKAFTDLTEEERTSRQLRGDGETRLLQQALNYQEAANSNRKGASVGTIGHANWLMFDYNRGYTDDLEASGISDIFRIPKFAYYFYQSQRSPEEVYSYADSEVGPMVKIATYWTKDSPQTIRVFSNTEEVALYLNDSLIDRKKTTIDTYSDHLEYPPFHFDLAAFESGTLRAIAFIDGQEVARDEVKTAAEPKELKLVMDRSGMELAKDHSDVVFVYAHVLDENGVLVSDAENEISFSLDSGNGRLIGANPVKAEAGIATILLRTESFNELIKISAESEGLISNELLLIP